MADLKSKAEAHRAALLDIIVEFVAANPGATNADIAGALGLKSAYLGQ